jgi:hypothetical protein
MMNCLSGKPVIFVTPIFKSKLIGIQKVEPKSNNELKSILQRKFTTVSYNRSKIIMLVYNESFHDNQAHFTTMVSYTLKLNIPY